MSCILGPLLCMLPSQSLL
uniref:Uncharacterized protein LOC105134550 n=1 Tax=Rhizophora mucronata TaxID=61149 RepID=A0A2P2NSD8_RHIMU